MTVTPRTRLHTVLHRHPETEDVFASWSIDVDAIESHWDLDDVCEAYGVELGLLLFELQGALDELDEEDLDDDENDENDDPRDYGEDDLDEHQNYNGVQYDEDRDEYLDDDGPEDTEDAA